MFEKEAIIHAFEATIGIECLNKPIEDFTYEELSDEQQEKAYDFKKGAEFGYNKANEWHFVSKEGFPNKDDIYLIIRSDGLHLGDYCCGGDGDIDCQSWCDYPSEEEIQDDSVIAWKEITLPEEEVLAEEMERQRIANYDFERGDVKY